ncbi:MAG: DUF5652 family protein [Nanoarchaeota archaeon]
MVENLIGIMGLAGIGGFLILILIIDLILKGIALWKSARNDQNVWFVVLLMVNSAGILPLIYLIWFQKNGKKLNKSTKRKRRKK